MNELDKDQILSDIKPFKADWIVNTDWWFGSTTAFKNAPLGYDVNVCMNEETNQIEAIVYALVKNEDNGHLEISKDTLFKFEIEIEIATWEQGNILTPIAIEEDAPFKIGTNYLITEVKEVEKEDKTVNVYTLNDHIDFKYTSHEISAYFKKAELS